MIRKLAGLAALLLLAACLIAPGKFTATLDLRRDGHFAFVYQGEITVLGLSKLAAMGAKAERGDGKFVEQPCLKDDGPDERPCTKDEIAKQKADWEAEQKAAAEREKKNLEAMQAMMGGIDPTSPQAGEELAARLRKQAGWKTVTYKGDGLYVVDFAIAGTLDHDFAFPTIERMPMLSPFLSVNRRADGAARVDAPAFGPANNANPLANFGQLAAMGEAMGRDGKDDAPPPMPKLDGTFTIVTDGVILANNTNDGPVADPRGQRLEWAVNPRLQAPPMALIKLGVRP